MPTGYTAEILNGEIKTFPEFAKKCARAFGAMIHMRDDSLDATYKKKRAQFLSQRTNERNKRRNKNTQKYF